MRWGDVALGTAPAPSISDRPTTIELQEIKPRDDTEQKLSLPKILAAPPEQQQQVLASYLITWLANSLQLLPHEIEPELPLIMWLDSLMAFSLKSRIETDLEISIPIKNFLGENNLTDLTQLILDRITLSNLAIVPSVNSHEISERETDRETMSL